MQFPLSFSDLSLVLAVVTIILAITSELASPYLGRTNLPVEQKVLRRTAILVFLAFLFTVFVRAYQIILAP